MICSTTLLKRYRHPDMTRSNPPPRKGRGATFNPDNRYHDTTHEAFDDGWGGLELPLPKLITDVQIDRAQSVIAYNHSPDVPFDRSINPYRGCEHGCVYCFARPTHAYLDLSPGLDFESRLFYKPDAAKCLREELAHPRYRCAPIALGINTDAYQPIERQLGITRQILEVLVETRHPVSIVTKSALIERDLDLLRDLARDNLVSVAISMTTLDNELARKMEPRATAPHRRLRIIESLSAANIPSGALIAPVIPFLNDHELEQLLEAIAIAGASFSHYVLLRLPLEVKALFESWLIEHYPLKAQRVMNRIRDSHAGKAYDANFGTRMTGRGLYADMVAQRFARAVKQFDLCRDPMLITSRFQPPLPSSGQLPLF